MMWELCHNMARLVPIRLCYLMLPGFMLLLPPALQAS